MAKSGAGGTHPLDGVGGAAILPDPVDWPGDNAGVAQW